MLICQNNFIVCETSTKVRQDPQQLTFFIAPDRMLHRMQYFCSEPMQILLLVAGFFCGLILGSLTHPDECKRTHGSVIQTCLTRLLLSLSRAPFANSHKALKGQMFVSPSAELMRASVKLPPPARATECEPAFLLCLGLKVRSKY